MHVHTSLDPLNFATAYTFIIPTIALDSFLSTAPPNTTTLIRLSSCFLVVAHYFHLELCQVGTDTG